MGKLVDLVSSGMGLAREMSGPRQPALANKTPHSVRRDSSSLYWAGNDQHTQCRCERENNVQTEHQECLADSPTDHLRDRRCGDCHSTNDTAAEGEPRNLENPVNQWICSPPPYTVEEYGHVRSKVVHPAKQHHALGNMTVRGRLSSPVIIPQRKPEHKERGFIRAYAPALLECGIDQVTFLHFLDSLNQATKTQPALDVVNMAAFAVGFVPSAAAQVASVAASIGVKVAKSSQMTRHSNAFLDRMNETLFKPHGLIGMMTTYKPDQKSSMVGVDMFRSSGTTNGELQLPEAAALVFPEDEARDGRKNPSSFTADYSDKPSYATYSKANPESPPHVTPEQNLRSRFSDPNHTANNGGILSLASGGAVNVKQIRERRREQRERRRGNRKEAREERSFGHLHDPSSLIIGSSRESVGARTRVEQRQTVAGGLRESLLGNRPEGQPRTLIGGAREALKHGMKQGVVYLMIINNPAEE